MANFFRQQRAAKGLTQQQVADAVGVKVQAVSAWERNIAFPQRGLWAPIASLFGIDLSNILDAATARANRKSHAA